MQEKYTELAPGFSISRILTGLWQIADMERDGKELDPLQASEAMAPYVEAGLTTFDMADLTALRKSLPEPSKTAIPWGRRHRC